MKLRASLVSQSVKNLPAVQETWVQSLGWEDPLEKEMATHSSILAWEISWTEKHGGLQSMGWCYPTISSSVVRFSFDHQSFPASGSFPMSLFFASDGQSIGASASVLPMNIQSLFPLGLTDLISLLSKGHSRVFSSTTFQKHQFISAQPSLWSNSHIHT